MEAEVRKMNVRMIKEESPFKDLFEVDPKVLEGVKVHMEEHGYDPSQPLVVWKERGVIIDGHTRLQAIKESMKRTPRGLMRSGKVPVIELSFSTEEEAVEYAIHNQTERRNLTEGDILKLVEKVDQRSTNWGGARRRGGEAAESSFENPKLDSREKTARIVGISEDKVSYCRHLLAHCERKIIDDIVRGEKTLYKAYFDSIEGRRRERARYSKEDEKQAILQKISTKPFEMGTSRQAIRRYATYTKHRDAICLNLLPQLLKKTPVIEKFRQEVEVFKKEGEEASKGLSSQKYIQEFLASALVRDFLWVLEFFGFGIKWPEGVAPAKIVESDAPRRRRRGGFDIGKVHEVGFRSKAEIGALGEPGDKAAEKDLQRDS